MDIQRTAKNSLLQMLNTIVKRVTCHLAIHDSALSEGSQTPMHSDGGGGTPLSVSIPVSRGHSPVPSPRDALAMQTDGASLGHVPALCLAEGDGEGEAASGTLLLLLLLSMLLPMLLLQAPLPFLPSLCPD